MKCYFHELHPELTKGKYDPLFLQQLEERGFPLTITDYEAAASPVGKRAKTVRAELTPLRSVRTEQACVPRTRAPAEVLEQTAQTPRRSARLVK